MVQSNTVGFTVVAHFSFPFQAEAVTVASKLVSFVLPVEHVNHILNDVVGEVLVWRPAEVGLARLEMVLLGQTLPFQLFVGVDMALAHCVTFVIVLRGSWCEMFMGQRNVRKRFELTHEVFLKKSQCSADFSRKLAAGALFSRLNCPD
jgi:hypothetical protein